MNRQVLQLHIDRQAEQQAADAEQQSDHQKGMSVHAEKIHGRQIRQYQVGFASACVFRLRVSECGKQQAQKGRHGLVLTLEECFSAFLDGAGDFLHFRSPLVRADDLACEKKGHNERKNAHGRKKVHPVLCCHKSSMLNFWLPF